MSQLDVSTLTEYIKHAIDLESAVVGQKEIIQQYDISSQQKRPVLKQSPVPQEPVFNEPSSDPQAVKMLACLFVCGLIFGLPGIALLSSSIEGGIMMIAVGVLFCIPGLLYFISSVRKQLLAEKNYNQQMANYKEKCEDINERNVQVKENYQSNLQKWSISHGNALTYLNNKLHESEAALQEYYSADIIFPKYRSLPALTMMYEYLTTGRCTELAGPNGAYNLYESELRQNTIISQLNVVISQLEQIKYSQYMLYEEVRKINYNTQIIASEIAAIRSYTYVLTELTALNTYYSGIAAQSASAMAFYQALS